MQRRTGPLFLALQSLKQLSIKLVFLSAGGEFVFQQGVQANDRYFYVLILYDHARCPRFLEIDAADRCNHIDPSRRQTHLIDSAWYRKVSLCDTVRFDWRPKIPQRGHHPVGIGIRCLNENVEIVSADKGN